MLKFGIISEIDFTNGLARVYFEEDDFVSAPLKMAVMRSGTDKISFPFDVKEHVYCLMDDNLEYGVICGAIYDEKNLPHADAGKGILSINFGDGSSILFNRNSHTLNLDIKGKVNIEATEINLKAPITKIDGILEVTGAAKVVGILSIGGLAGISGAPIPGSSTELNVQKITATDDVTAGAVSLKTHKHISAASGSPTSTPIP